MAEWPWGEVMSETFFPVDAARKSLGGQAEVRHAARATLRGGEKAPRGRDQWYWSTIGCRAVVMLDGLDLIVLAGPDAKLAVMGAHGAGAEGRQSEAEP